MSVAQYAVPGNLPVAGTSRPRQNTTETDSHGAALLTSFINFIGPIVAATHPPFQHFQEGSGEDGQFASRMRESAEGRELVQSLVNFIELVANARVDNTDTKEAVATGIDESVVLPEESQNVNPALGIQDRSTSVLTDWELATLEKYLEDSLFRRSRDWQRSIRTIDNQYLEISRRVNKRVFNEMPIRVIGFDENGGKLRLLERNQIVDSIMSRIKATDPKYIGLGADDDIQLEAVVSLFSGYAILSHTWIQSTPGEVLYQDWGNFVSGRLQSPGSSKITNFCRIAAHDCQVSFGWMDTVCIDKRSSSELDESIRSMYKWYKNSKVCVTFLAGTSNITEMHNDPWFTRGWTLQELAAPYKVNFYNQGWKILHPDDDTPLMRQKINIVQKQVTSATDITPAELRSLQADPIGVPVSRVMQLAAKRRVTREEDSVYSLMGLLSVGMPIAYGEGSTSALKRLIREIMLSRSEFIDLFNHHSPHSLIPLHISDYIESRHVNSATRDVRKSSYQLKPVVLTHTAIHATAIMIPAFRHSMYMGSIPREVKTQLLRVEIDQSPSIKLRQKEDYILFDDHEHSANWISSLPRLTHHPRYLWTTEAPHMLFLAILDFADSNGAYHFSTQPYCIPVHIHSPNTIGKHPSKIDIELNQSHQTSGPITVSLPYGTDSVYSIKKEKATRLGIQVATSYFT